MTQDITPEFIEEFNRVLKIAATILVVLGFGLGLVSGVLLALWILVLKAL